MKSEELRFEVNGHLIAAKAWGDSTAAPVIALHGWLDNAATFNRLAPLLKSVRLIALDLMGHGYSHHRPASMPYYIWDNVLDVLGVAEQLGLERFDLLGHSMGASIAMLIAGAYPEKVRQLVLIDGHATAIVRGHFAHFLAQCTRIKTLKEVTPGFQTRLNRDITDRRLQIFFDRGAGTGWQNEIDMAFRYDSLRY